MLCVDPFVELTLSVALIDALLEQGIRERGHAEMARSVHTAVPAYWIAGRNLAPGGCVGLRPVPGAQSFPSGLQPAGSASSMSPESGNPLIRGAGDAIRHFALQASLAVALGAA